MNKFTKSPLSRPELAGKEEEVREFVQGALLNTKVTNETEEYPWESLDDTEKTKGINLRLTKADLAKLQYISNNTPYSMQAFCYENLKTAIDKMLFTLKEK